MTTIPPHEICRLPTRHHIGKQVWQFSRLDSTNTLALALAAEPKYDGLVLLADEQSAGRGQYGRTWTAPPGSSVLLSALLFPPAQLHRPALLTALAAVSVCETIREVTSLQAVIKWPNDVLLEGRKVCGILIEQRNTGLAERPLAATVGIGLNVRQEAAFFARADLPMAGSLASLSGQACGKRQVAERLIGHLDSIYDRLLQGDSETLEQSWKNWLRLCGKQVRLELTHESKKGRIVDVSWDGVVLESIEGPVLIAPESIRHIHPCL